jgi:TatD DNase family protein
VIRPGVGLVDTHCHIAHIETDPAAIVAEAAEAGVDVVIDIGMGTEESSAAVERAAELGGGVYATVGVHPNDLAEFERGPDVTMAALRELARQPRVVGIGETGLDHYRDRSDPALQEEAFRAQIELSRETDRTLVIHCRDAHDRLLEVLVDSDPPDHVVMHCFSGDVEFARACSERGFYCSFAGNLTYKRSDDLRDIARWLPEELLLVETDAPFLAPERHRGKENRPAFLPLTASVLADVRLRPLDELSVALRDNAARAFQLR